MNIERTKTNKALIISVIAAILILGLFSVVAYQKSWWPFSYFQSSNIQEQAKEDNSNVAGQEDQSETKINPSVDEPTEEIGGEATFTITQLSQENNTIILRSTLENVSEGGRCIAYFSSDGGSVAKYATIEKSGDALLCSLDVSALEFSYLGTWSVRLVYTSTDDKKIETTQDITIE